MEEGSSDEQVCEIEVKKMYIAVERKVSELLQELLRQNELYFGSLFDGLSKNSTYTPPANVGITRASDVCFAVTGWLKRHLESANHALDGGNLEQYISFLLYNIIRMSFCESIVWGIRVLSLSMLIDSFVSLFPSFCKAKLCF